MFLANSFSIGAEASSPSTMVSVDWSGLQAAPVPLAPARRRALAIVAGVTLFAVAVLLLLALRARQQSVRQHRDTLRHWLTQQARLQLLMRPRAAWHACGVANTYVH